MSLSHSEQKEFVLTDSINREQTDLSSAFSKDELLTVLKTFPETDYYCLGFSGGLDSLVLLHALAESKNSINKKIIAIHVNHGLSPAAEKWNQHCFKIAETFGIDYKSVSVDASPVRGESPEAWARQLRYAAFETAMPSKAILLTAHHQDDQAETLLLQLFRGSGPAGLAAMPVIRQFGSGWHVRPLLQYSREQLEAYANLNKLDWVEDESNQDTRFDRNFLRHQVLPMLEGRWPSITKTLMRSAVIQQEVLVVLDETAASDSEICKGLISGALNIPTLLKLSPERCHNLIRYWLKNQALAIPEQTQLKQIIGDVLHAKEDATPCVAWSGTEVRRYRDDLLAMPSLPESPQEKNFEWDMNEVLHLPLGELQTSAAIGKGIKKESCAGETITVRFRQGGETIKRPGQKHHQELKKLFQEYAIPSWVRQYIPMIYINDVLISVGGFWNNESYQTDANEEGLCFSWSMTDQLFKEESDK